MDPKYLLPEGLRELLELEHTRWPEIRERIRQSGHPTNDGEGAGEGGSGEEEAGGEGGSEEESAAGGEGDSGEEKVDWKQQSRKHERRAKEASKKAGELEARLKELEDAGASDQEKAVAKAREEAAATAKAEAIAELREDRLEVAVTRLSNGITVKDGDKDVKVSFADPDDALLHIQRAIKAGDVDEDDIFNEEGKVQTDALKTALIELLERKPHLKATSDGGNAGAGKVAGSADGGKGSGAGKDEESLSPEERFARLQKDKK